MRKQLRYMVRRILPRFLAGWRGQRVMYALTVVQDAMIEWAIQGVLARFPQFCTPTALGAIGRDRRIVRGFDETDGIYRARLLRWLDDWRIAGHAYSILGQVAGYLSGHSVKLRIVTNTGLWYTRDTDGTLSYYKATNWDWDGDTASWSRFWLIIYPPASLWTEVTWGNGDKWGDAELTVGSTATRKQRDDIRHIVQTWKPAHTECSWIVLAFDGASFDPAGGTVSDGTWGINHKGTAPVVHARLTTARYWKGAA